MVNSGDCIVPMGQSWSLKLLTRPVLEKPVTGLWPSSAPVAGAVPKGPFFQLPGSLLTVHPLKVPSSEPTVLSEVKVVPSKSPTKYWPPDPPPTAPGLMLTTMTHLMLFGSPSTAMGNRSGHSHWPPLALADPNVLSCVQV